MILFTKIRMKNLFSIGNQFLEVDLNSHKTTLVIGKNGSGKSAATVDALHLALFNKPFRDITKASCINSVNRGATVIELYFTKGSNDYKIIRGLKPNVFEIYENDTLLNQEASARDDQAFLEDTILDGLNDKVFKQVVMIGSANYVPFMQLTAGQRREVIEELLDIKIFSHINVLVKDKLSWYKDTLSNLDMDIKFIEQKIILQTANQKKIEDDAEERLKDLEDKLATHNSTISNCNQEIINLTAQRDKIAVPDLNKIQTAKTKAENMKIQLEMKHDDIEHTIRFFETNCSCSTCQQSITDEHKELILTPLKTKKSQLVSAIATLTEQVKDGRAKMLEAGEAHSKINEFNRKIHDQTNLINSSNRIIADIFSSIAKIRSNALVQDSSNIIDQLKNDLQVAKDKRIKEQTDKKYYDAIAILLKDGGIKSKIIKQYIPVMNKIINEYLVRFGLPIEFTLDEEFSEVIKSRYRDAFKYNNFSEGEKKRIDMALLLAWRQLARSKNTTNCNLLIMDETFDTSLDSLATDELLTILQEMDKNTNIFIISHKNDLSEKVDRTLEYVKKGNFTQLNG